MVEPRAAGVALTALIVALAALTVGAPVKAETRTSTVTGTTDAPAMALAAETADAPAMGVVPVTANAPAVADAQEPTIVAAYTFRLTPERPGQVGVTLTFDLPATVSQFRAELPDGTVVEGTDGFRATGAPRTYEWDESTRRPTVRFVWNLPTDRIDEPDAVDAGEWALLTRPDVDTRWRYTDEAPTFRVEMSAAGSGVAAGKIAYLGPYEERTVAGTDQQFRLIVPEAATLAAGNRVDGTLRDASRLLDVGDRDPTVAVFVVPDSISFGAVDAREYRNAFWIRADARVRTPDNLWVHEYVHARQAYEPTDRMEWIDEGTADYYAALVTLNQGHLDYDRFHAYVSTDAGASARLVEAAGTDAEYTKGRRVVAALDAKLRQLTDGRRTFQDVFRRMNAEEELTYAEFKDVVAAVAGQRLDDWLDRYVTTDAVPPVPDDAGLYVMATADDPDDDGLPGAERDADTDPFAADTDGDGVEDGEDPAPTNPSVPAGEPREPDGPGLPLLAGVALLVVAVLAAGGLAVLVVVLLAVARVRSG